MMKPNAKASREKATCKTNKDATGSRIDFILANSRLTPAITICYVDGCSDYPTHRPLIIEIVTKLLEKTSRELKKPTNSAKMLSQKIEAEIEEAAVKREEERGETGTITLKERRSTASGRETSRLCTGRWIKLSIKESTGWTTQWK